MPQNILFGDLHQLVQQQYKALALQQPAAHSTSWFLLRYIRRVLRASEQPATAWRVQAAVRAMMRFYLDNIDERSEQGALCQAVYHAYKASLKQAQQSAAS